MVNRAFIRAPSSVLISTFKGTYLFVITNGSHNYRTNNIRDYTVYGYIKLASVQNVGTRVVIFLISYN